MGTKTIWEQCWNQIEGDGSNIEINAKSNNQSEEGWIGAGSHWCDVIQFDIRFKKQWLTENNRLAKISGDDLEYFIAGKWNRIKYPLFTNDFVFRNGENGQIYGSTVNNGTESYNVESQQVEGQPIEFCKAVWNQLDGEHCNIQIYSESRKEWLNYTYSGPLWATGSKYRVDPQWIKDNNASAKKKFESQDSNFAQIITPERNYYIDVVIPNFKRKNAVYRIKSANPQISGTKKEKLTSKEVTKQKINKQQDKMSKSKVISTSKNVIGFGWKHFKSQFNWWILDAVRKTWAVTKFAGLKSRYVLWVGVASYLTFTAYQNRETISNKVESTYNSLPQLQSPIKWQGTETSSFQDFE